MAKQFSPPKITTCDRATRFCKRIGSGLAVVAAGVIYVSGVGNILVALFGGDVCHEYANGTYCSSSHFEGPIPYITALIGTGIIVAVGGFLYTVWTED